MRPTIQSLTRSRDSYKQETESGRRTIHELEEKCAEHDRRMAIRSYRDCSNCGATGKAKP